MHRGVEDSCFATPLACEEYACTFFIKNKGEIELSNRVKYIDTAKGIAIWCIVIGHFGIWNITRTVYPFHVPIFFLITGYFTSKKLPLKDFLKNKARTLLIPYAWTSIAMILLALVRNLILNEGNTKWVAWYWLRAAFYGAGGGYTEPFEIPSIGAIWFLWASFWGSVFLRIILEQKEKVRGVLVVLLFCAGCVTAEKFFWFPFSIQAGCCATLYMYIGYLARQVREVHHECSQEIKMVVAILAFVVYLEFFVNFEGFWLYQSQFGRGVIDVFGSICASYVVILVSKWLEVHSSRLTAVLSFFGRYSLIVLCVHIIELNIFPWGRFLNMWVALGCTEKVATLLMAFGKIVFIIGATYVCSKVKFIKKLFQLEK